MTSSTPRIAAIIRNVHGNSRILKHSSQLLPFQRSTGAVSSECSPQGFLTDFAKSCTSFTSRSFFTRCCVYAKEKKAEEHLSPIFNVQDEHDFKKRVLDSKVPVIVDFHAAWCGPCKLLGPRLEALIAARKGQVTMAKVDIDANDELANQYQIRSVPTVLAIKNGKIVDQFIGLADDDKIKTVIDKLLC